MSKKQKLYLVDGSSYIFRAFYAIQPLSNSKGLPTNAIYGFARMLLKLIREEKPDKIAVVFDTKEPTFRDELYDKYKANRKEPPDDLVPQFPYFQPLVDAMGIKKMALSGFEADDVIGTVAKKGEAEGYEVVIVTGDKDFMQLVDENITLYDTMKERRISFSEVKEKFGVRPDQVIDVMSLVGDSSDNIPGVPGIGDKGAVALISQFGTLDNLLANIDKVGNNRSKNALKDDVDKAHLSRELVTIRLDTPVEFSWDELNLDPPKEEELRKLLSELEFFKLLNELLPKKKSAERKDYKILSSKTELDNLLKEISKSDEVALYFPDSGGRALGLGISFGDRAAYLPLAHETLEDVANVDKNVFAEFIKNINAKKIYLFDLKSNLKMLSSYGAGLPPESEDVLLASYVLNPDNPKDIPQLAQKILGISLGATDEKKQVKKTITLKSAADETCLLADALAKIAGVLEKELSGSKVLKSIYGDMELPLARILYKIEQNGIKIDSAKLEMLSKEYAGKIAKLEEKIFEEAGEKFMISSPKQLGVILFEKLGLPAGKKTKTGFSTEAGVLEELSRNYKLPKYVLEYRSLTKLKSTYIDALPALADPISGRIHTTFNQAVTATGRLSSSNPNLQNVPARTEEGQRIRSAFITEKGNLLLSADYSQIELRILAHISKETALLKAFAEGLDIHTATASQVFGVDPKAVDNRMRSLAKTVNFGVLYGQSAYGLSSQLEIEVSEADEYIKNYYKGYPKVKELKEKILEDAKKTGYVETLFGRRRYVPDILSKNRQVQSFAERTAFNAVFQGTAADIIKMAMIKIDAIISKDFQDVSMLLQVHDELVFEAPEKTIDKLTDVVKDAMCSVARLDVPLEVNAGAGPNWAECS